MTIPRARTYPQMRNILEEVQIEIIKNSLHKIYLEDFYRVCQVR